jgi:steroid delta-isomerase-like uncharacterized protein
MTHDDVLALFEKRRTALERRDVAALAALYADHARLESPFAGVVTGAEAIAKASDAFLTAFPDATFDDEPPIIQGDRVAVAATVTGTHVGEMMGLPPSGRTIRFSLAVFLTVADGRIVEERRIYDFTGLLVQVGVLKAKPA